MSKDEIIKMARESKIECDLIDEDEGQVWYITTETLERFAALVEQHMIASGYRKCAVGQRTTQFCGQLEQAVLAEREACAKVCEEDRWITGFGAAAAIRARGEK